MSLSSGKRTPYALSQAFTLVEILCAITIIALIILSMIPFVGDYVTQARKTTEKRTLLILNDALTRYKTQGGDLSALTLGAPIGNILRNLQTPITWAGVSHQFLQSGVTYNSNSLVAVGEGELYRFFQYNDYIAEVVPSGTPTSNSMPYGSGVGYIERAGSADANMEVRPTSGYAAYQINNGAVQIGAVSGSNVTITVPANSNLKVWSCAGAADSTKSGYISYFYAHEMNLTKIDVTGLEDLEWLDCYTNNITTLDVSNLTKLKWLFCYGNSISTLDVSNCIILEGISASSNNLTGSLDLSNCAPLYFISLQTNNLTSVDISGLSNIQNLYLQNNNISGSIDVSGITTLERIYCYGNSGITSLNVSGCTSIDRVYCYNTSISSLNLSGLSTLSTLYSYNTNISSLDLTGCTGLGGGWISYSNISSLDLTDIGSGSWLEVDDDMLAIADVLGFAGYIYIDVNAGDLVPTAEMDARTVYVDAYDLSLADATTYLNNLPATAEGSWVYFDGTINTSDSGYVAALSAAQGNGWTIDYW